MFMVRPSLNPSEWFVVSFFLILLCSLILIAKISSLKAKNILSAMPQMETVQIKVSGEVLRPGVHELRAGSLCGEVLERVKPKRFADLSGIDLKAPAPLAFFVPRLERIHVFVEGEGVEPCELFVPPGTRISDLKSKIVLRQNGDVLAFRSRKMLSDGEVILVKKRK
jgi:hypothetical protein